MWFSQTIIFVHPFVLYSPLGYFFLIFLTTLAMISTINAAKNRSVTNPRGKKSGKILERVALTNHPTRKTNHPSFLFVGIEK